MKTNYSYELIRDEKLGMMVVEFVDNQKNSQWNAQWELTHVLKAKKYFIKEKRLDIFWKWLQANHPELLL